MLFLCLFLLATSLGLMALPFMSERLWDRLGARGFELCQRGSGVAFGSGVVVLGTQVESIVAMGPMPSAFALFALALLLHAAVRFFRHTDYDFAGGSLLEASRHLRPAGVVLWWCAALLGAMAVLLGAVSVLLPLASIRL